MKISISVAFLLFMLGIGLLISSCDNNSSNEGKQVKTDTVPAKTDTAKDNRAPVGKVLKGSDVDIHTVGNTMKYDVSEIHVPAGNKVSITLYNDGNDPSMLHNVAILKAEDADSVAMQGFRAGQKADYLPLDKSKIIAYSSLAKPGEKTVLNFKAPEKGEYLFMCTYPGHYKTMQGKFIVE